MPFPDNYSSYAAGDTAEQYYREEAISDLEYQQNILSDFQKAMAKAVVAVMAEYMPKFKEVGDWSQMHTDNLTDTVWEFESGLERVFEPVDATLQSRIDEI